MINQLLNERILVLNSKNNYKHVYKKVTKKDYIHIFTSPEITLFKKYKKNILDDSKFIDWLYLLTIDEIYFVDK